MIVTDLGRHFDGPVQLVKRMPVAAFRDEFIAVQRGIVADHHAIVFRIQFDDINRLGRGDAQALALADGVKFNAVMVAQHLAVQIHDFAAMLLREAGLLEEAAVIVVRHETDFHALFLVRRLELAMPRHFPRVALGLFAERKNRARELVLPQREQKITLVLARIASALEQMPRTVRAFFHPGKMAGGDVIRAELVGAVNEPAELKILVAHHARIRRAAGLVFIGKILDDVLLEFRRLVNQIIRNVQLVANRAGIGDRLRAAAFVLGAVHAILRPEFQRDADIISHLATVRTRPAKSAVFFRFRNRIRRAGSGSQADRRRNGIPASRS